MNFIEAVQALKDGRCELIRCGGVYIGLYHDILRCYHEIDDYPKDPSTTFNFFAKDYLSDGWKVVGSKPQYRGEEVVSWAILSLATNAGWPKGALYEVEQEWVPEGYYQIKLCGTRKVLVKPKVKQRIEVSSSVIVANSNIIPEDATFYAEWEEEEG